MTDAGLPLLGIGPPSPRGNATLGESGYVRRSRNFYPTAPWVTRELLESVGPGYFGGTIWECACGDGRMAKVLSESGYRVLASDIHDYGYPGTLLVDFLRDPPPEPNLAAIVTNPPFGDDAIRFIDRAVELTASSGIRAQMGPIRRERVRRE